MKHVTGTASLQGHADCLLDASVRHFSSAPSAQSASTEENGYAILFYYLDLSHGCVLLHALGLYAELAYRVNPIAEC